MFRCSCLNCGGVPDESGGHFETFGWNVANTGFDVVRYPLHEVGRVFVLHVEHLLVYFFGAHAAAEHGGRRQVAAVPWIRSAHHVLGIPHLLCQLRDREGAVLLWASRREGRKADHEEVEARERDEVDCQLAQIGVELTRESQATSHATHGRWDKMVQITNCVHNSHVYIDYFHLLQKLDLEFKK